MRKGEGESEKSSFRDREKKESESERKSLQDLVNRSYELFIGEVATARKLDINNEKSWANARIFLADDAKKLGLIDDIKTYQEVLDITAKVSGVSDPVWKKSDKFDKFINSLSTKMANLIVSEFFIKIK